MLKYGSFPHGPLTTSKYLQSFYAVFSSLVTGLDISSHLDPRVWMYILCICKHVQACTAKFMHVLHTHDAWSAQIA